MASRCLPPSQRNSASLSFFLGDLRQQRELRRQFHATPQVPRSKAHQPPHPVHAHLSANDVGERPSKLVLQLHRRPWQKLGGFTPDSREAPYFDIGVIGPGHGQDFNLDTYFFQFGVGSKSPVTGWSVQLIDPSFQYQGYWRVMEKAAVIQGNLSFWKGAYRWGGAPYPGVTAQSNALDASFPMDSVEFSYTGGTLKNNTPLW